MDKQNKSYILTGTLLVLLGIVLLVVGKRFINIHLPVLSIAWPVILFALVVAGAYFIKNVILSTILVIVGLIAVTSYITDAHLFRTIVGLGCIGLGLLLLYYLVADAFLKRK